MSQELGDAESLATEIVRLRLVEEGIVREAVYEIGGPATPAPDLLRYLERRGYLTPLQSGKLAKGDRDGYFLGGYRLLYRIASGSFGRVYRGDDPRTGQIVAVKILRRRHTEDPRRVEHFEREGRLGRSIQHTNIVGILAVSKDEPTGQYYIVMEFVEGGNLRDILNIRKKVELDEALRIMEECAAGLAYAHSKGLTHRDIKPTNILLGTDRVAKLVDFGLAEIQSGASLAFTVNMKGPLNEKDEDAQMDRTIDYAGLEKNTGVKPGDIRSDIYFLGHVLYEMITGEALIPRTRDKNQAHQKRRYEDCEAKLHAMVSKFGIHPAAAKVIAKAIAFNPATRYQTPTAFMEAIKAARTEISGGGDTRRASGPLTIYVVEDNAKLQDVFRERFKKLGFRVLISADAGNALSRYRQAPYHALLIDAGSVGHAAIDSFKSIYAEAQQSYLDLAGILILNEDQAGMASRARDLPGGAALVRPVGLRELVGHLKSALPEFTGEEVGA